MPMRRISFRPKPHVQNATGLAGEGEEHGYSASIYLLVFPALFAPTPSAKKRVPEVGRSTWTFSSANRRSGVRFAVAVVRPRI